MVRPAEMGERVVTSLDGRVTSTIIVRDDTSVVVRGVGREVYVLSKAKFEQGWDPKPIESPTANVDPVQQMLLSQGYREHRCKPSKRWIYKLTKDDMAKMPGSQFETNWGAIQVLKEGDHLAMPAPKENANELYFIPETALAGYCPDNK